jgi:large subunit ribosomal protein L32e
MTPDEETPGAAEAPETPGAALTPEAPAVPTPTPKKSDARRRPKTGAEPTAAGAKGSEASTAKPAKKTKKEEVEKAPRRPTLDPELARLLSTRDRVDARRPLFVAQAAHRYWRIGRKQSWRRPRGLQSKQRRHYGYRSEVVSIGYGSPRRTRGLTPTGFRPVLVRTPKDLDTLDRLVDAAIIARTVGTRRRLVLEESARKLGIHVLNPITPASQEE